MYYTGPDFSNLMSLNQINYVGNTKSMVNILQRIIRQSSKKDESENANAYLSAVS